MAVDIIQVPHRDEFSDTVAFKLRGPDQTVLFVPDIDRWEGNAGILIEDLLEDVDIAYIDGTFYDGSELPGRDMSEVPHPLIIDTMDRFSTIAEDTPGKIRFIHLNHTNPAFSNNEIEKQIRERGFRIALQGERVGL